MNKRNEILKNCTENKNSAISKTLLNNTQRVKDIADEMCNKTHKYYDLYSQIHNDIPTVSLDINPLTDEVNILKNTQETSRHSNINWCDTCESTTLKDCLECVNGNKNPNWKSEKDLTIDEVNNVEEHFLETVKNAKIEDLEKVYNIVSSELKKRYNTNDVIDKNLKSDTTIPSIKGKLYYQKNNEEPLEVKIELSENDIKEFETEIETEINKTVHNILKSFRLFNSFKF